MSEQTQPHCAGTKREKVVATGSHVKRKKCKQAQDNALGYYAWRGVELHEVMELDTVLTIHFNDFFVVHDHRLVVVTVSEINVNNHCRRWH